MQESSNSYFAWRQSQQNFSFSQSLNCTYVKFSFQALSEPLQYPGRMETYPGQMKNQLPLFVHDCIAGCPGMGPKPLMPVAGKPLKKLSTIVRRTESNTQDAKDLEDFKGHP